MTYNGPKESKDEYHPIYNSVVAWLDGEERPAVMNAPKARPHNRVARNQAGAKRGPTKPAAVPAE